jgi:ABC-type multidrug transport system ATPase subunit
MIEIRELRVRFGAADVLAGITLTIPAGERVAFLGPNGAGKTTLLRALLAHVPFTGRAAIGGHDVREDGLRARALVGYVPQSPAFPPHLTTGEVVAYVQAIRSLPADPLRLLAQVGLEADAAKPVGALSGGMARRLALAVAQIGDPPLLLMDEPASYLDAGGESLLRAWLENAASRGRTAVLATHHLNGLQTLVDRMVLLEGGRVRSDADVDAVRAARWFEIRTPGPAPALPEGVAMLPSSNGLLHLRARERALPALLALLGERPVDIHESALLDVLREVRP